ncbi:HTH-type transcriptional repressor NagR [Sporomusa silvacetica DSM 10669]|uniref:HTH-type transcriptional repressor NagR n=1 Tax=Sporomusa silvacetica DSM 10669 TaxID=1123289 RepID=A0ABZ3IRY2_9FIRM|nr:GntR family transcriptional regulator [Sporomusa silvacetica]OZC20805.1 HTH-type transcriptional repressor YvoA [Sporomusa silvacetica DSM 10669]
MEKINKNSFTPPFYQLATILEKKILTGQLKAGESLPSENDLGREYELSRTTVRKCLSLLAERGLISTQQGKGTFVSRPSLDRAEFLMGEFHTHMVQMGKEPGYRLVEVRFRKELPEFAVELGMTAEQGILYYCRLLLADTEPVAVEHKYMLYIKGRPILENEFQYKAFSEIITIHTDILPVRSQAVLGAESVGEFDAKLLNVAQGSPVLKLQQALYASDNRPIGIGVFYYRGDRYSLVSDIHPLKGER